MEHNLDAVGHLPTHILDILLCHRSHEARASGLSILLASPSTTRPYASETLCILQKHLPSFHDDVDPKIRYDLLGHLRNMIRRLHNSINTLQKESIRASKKPKKKTAASEDTGFMPSHETVVHRAIQPCSKENEIQSPPQVPREYEEFIDWYARFLKAELSPTISYQRHITSLKAMNYFLKSNLIQGDEISVRCWPANRLVNNTWLRSVLDLIMDPYDDVRETAASLIMLLQSRGPLSGPPAHISGLISSPFEELHMFCRKANELSLKTARADHCDGAARSQDLLFRWSSSFEEAVGVLESIFSNLERKLCAAEKDLAAAVLQAPVHGDFASLRYVNMTPSNCATRC